MTGLSPRYFLLRPIFSKVSHRLAFPGFAALRADSLFGSGDLSAAGLFIVGDLSSDGLLGVGDYLLLLSSFGVASSFTGLSPVLILIAESLPPLLAGEAPPFGVAPESLPLFA